MRPVGSPRRVVRPRRARAGGGRRPRAPRIRGETVAYPTSPYRGRTPLRTPALVVDAVVLEANRLLLVRRGRPPFRGKWALPGGFVEIGETCERAVVRELREETGARGTVLRLVGVYSAPRRDPRAHLVSVAYLLKARRGAVKGDDDAADARWFPLGHLPPMAGDHPRILAEALRARRFARRRERRRERART